MRAYQLALVLLLPTVLGGCIGFGGGGDEDEPVDPTEAKRRAEVTDATGGIEGLVTDNAVQPVKNATVTVIERDITTSTAADGSYAFSKITPGTYTVEVTIEGFVPGSESVDVVAGAIATADFILVHLQSSEAYIQNIERGAYVECSQQVGYEARDSTNPVWNPARDQINQTTNRTIGENITRNPGFFFLGIATCGAPNVLVANSTQDRFFYAFELEAPVHTLVYEAEWDSGGNAMNEWLSLLVEIEGFSNDDDATFWEQDRRSPVYARIERDVFMNVSSYLKQECEAGDDDACISPWDEGWPLQLRIFAAWQCLSETAGGCAAFQQSITNYFSAFYNAPAPEGYTVKTAGGQ